MQQRGVGVRFNNLIKKSPQKTQGQALVEFALILTVMIGLFVGAFELMTLYRKRTDLATATRQAARQASELWIETNDANDFRDDVKAYVVDEMERMGYQRTWLEGSNTAGTDHIGIVIKSFEFDPLNSDTLQESATNPGLCTYGQYIQVELTMQWRFVVLPLNQLLGGGAPSAGALTEEVVVRCWRGT